MKKAEEKLEALGDQLKESEDNKNKALADFEKQQRDCGDREGSPGKGAAECCKAINNINNTWLSASNKLVVRIWKKPLICINGSGVLKRILHNTRCPGDPLKR